MFLYCFVILSVAMVSCKEQPKKALKRNFYTTRYDSDGKMRYAHTIHSFSIAALREEWFVVSNEERFQLSHWDPKNIYGVHVYFGKAANDGWNFWKDRLTAKKGTYNIAGLGSFNSRETGPSYWGVGEDGGYCNNYELLLYQEKPIPIYIHIASDYDVTFRDDCVDRKRETSSIKQALEVIKTLRHEGSGPREKK